MANEQEMQLEMLLNMHFLPSYLITSETTWESGCGLIVHAFLVNTEISTQVKELIQSINNKIKRKYIS